MNSKLARTLVLLAVLALFAVTFATVRPTEGRYTSDFAVSVGECGYYQNQGTLHRNGLVTPDYCSIPADGIAVTLYEKYIPVTVESPAIDTVDTESTQERESDDTEAEENPVVIVVENPVEDKPVITVPEVTVTPVPDETNGNNGNHYGNDSPDNNGNDVNNPHNGENTYDDHHGHNGNGNK